MKKTFFILITSLIMTNLSFGALPADFEQKLDEVIISSGSAGKFAGLSVLVLSKDGALIKKHYGFKDLQSQQTPDDQTLYELGSITKPFTRLAIATQSKVQVNDPMAKFLPSDVRVPKPAGKEILIRDLMTHTGIKFSLPCTIRIAKPGEVFCFGMDFPLDLTDPYKKTTRKGMYKFLNEYSYTLEEFPEYFKEPGLFYSYSNLGLALLGELLAQEHQTTYEAYLKTQVLDPLGMTRSKIAMLCESNQTCENLAKVYSKKALSEDWQEQSLWHMNEMSAAGGLRSNLEDMEKFVTAILHPESTPLEPAINTFLSPLHEATSLHNSNLCQAGQNPDVDLCNPVPKKIFYGLESELGGEILFHAGATGASQAMLVFPKDMSVGVVVLGNSKVGEGKAPAFHHANDVGLCALQLLGKLPAGLDFCKKVAN